MPLERVQRLFPDAKRAPGSGTPGHEQLRVEKVKLAGEDFTANFHFSWGELHSVMLSLDNAKDFHGSLPVFEAVVKNLAGEHGAPKIKRQRIHVMTVSDAEAVWTVGETAITVVLFSSQQAARLNIVYDREPSN